MQHMIIKYDDVTNEPFVTPYKAKIWRDDQSVMWSFAATNVWWDAAKPEPIVFHQADAAGVSAWPGSQPAPIGPPPHPSERDRRRFTADGGSPNMGIDTIKYMYDAWVEWEVFGESGLVVVKRGKLHARPEEGLFVKIEPIDPEILNEPQP